MSVALALEEARSYDYDGEAIDCHFPLLWWQSVYCLPIHPPSTILPKRSLGWLTFRRTRGDSMGGWLAYRIMTMPQGAPGP
eukprot:scaffold178334_cov31-Tisochrysis_lutea.AAC.3